ncbi:MAG: molybdenum ABC transporter ATP-binding protein [Bauldia sp.]|nr:molybdenum ABC transporter ATP-binding protein [Bauldia sp.]
MTLEVVARHEVPGFTLDVAFSAGAGVTALFGRSGAGKSTLAGIVAGLVRPKAGRVVLDGEVLLDTVAGIAVPARRRRIGVVFQEGRLFPHMTVEQNLLFGRRFRSGSSGREGMAAITELLGIERLLDRRPRTLSGGEQQRVAIGRALLMEPRALILDEPLASIDVPRRAEILPYLDRLKREMRVPILYVSHAIEEIARLADTVVVLDAGRVLAAGLAADIIARHGLPSLSPAEEGVFLLATVDRTVAGQGTILRHAAGELTVPVVAAPPGTVLRVRIHARDVALAVGEPGRLSFRNRLPATVSGIAAGDGDAVTVALDVGGSPVLARITRDAVADLDIRAGSRVIALMKAVAVEGY